MTANAATTIPTVHVVACGYSLPPIRIRTAMQRIGRQLGVGFRGVIVDNGSHDLLEADDNWVNIRGSNREQEFSAYVEGVDALREDGLSPASVLFINDSTFNRHNAKGILKELVRYVAAIEDISTPCIVGKADDYNSICYMNPWSNLLLYVSTFCFLLNRGAVPLIIEVVRGADLALGSKDVDISTKAWGAGLDYRFREYLRSHLSHPGLPTSWYQLPTHISNRQLINQKMRCVYLEHKLSGEVGREGLIFSIFPTPRSKLEFVLLEQIAKLSRAFGRSW